MDLWLSDEEEQLFVRFVKEMLTNNCNSVGFSGDTLYVDGLWDVSPELKEVMQRVIKSARR